MCGESNDVFRFSIGRTKDTEQRKNNSLVGITF